MMMEMRARLRSKVDRSRDRRAMAGTGLVAGLVLGALIGGCDEGGTTGPSPGSLTLLQRGALEEVAVDRVLDLFWVGSQTGGGTFPSLGYSYGLPGVGGGALAAITVDPSTGPGLGEAFCTPSPVGEVRQCLRVRITEGGDYDLQVYFTSPSESLPRMEPSLAFPGEEQVATVRFRPQPLRVWEFDLTPEGGVIGASATVGENFTLISEQGSSVELAVDGTMDASFGDPREVSLDLTVRGLSACSEITLGFEDADRDGADDEVKGTIRCGDRVWAEVRSSSDEPVRVVWRDGGA